MSITTYKGLSIDRMTDLINKALKSNYVYEDDFTLGSPRSIPPTFAKNTEIELFSTNPALQSKVYTYKRLNLDVLEAFNNDFAPVIIESVPFYIHDILPEINEKLGLDLIPSEVENTMYTTVSDRYNLKIDGFGTSLTWTESVYAFKAHVTTDREVLPVQYFKKVEQTVLEDTVTIDTEEAVIHSLTLTQPSTHILLETHDLDAMAKTITLLLTQQEGSQVVTWDSRIEWSFSREPVLGFNERQTDIITIVMVSVDKILGFYNGGGFYFGRT